MMPSFINCGSSQLLFVISRPKNFRIDNFVIVSADLTIITVPRCKTFTHNLMSCNIHTERLSYYCRKIRYQSLQVIRDSGIRYIKATNSVLTQGTCHFTLPSHLKHCPETSNALLFINHTASNEPDFVYELHEFAYWELNLWGREIPIFQWYGNRRVDWCFYFLLNCAVFIRLTVSSVGTLLK